MLSEEDKQWIEEQLNARFELLVQHMHEYIDQRKTEDAEREHLRNLTRY